MDNFVSLRLQESVADCTIYDVVIPSQKFLYMIKPKNKYFARLFLVTRRQQVSESLDEYILELKNQWLWLDIIINKGNARTSQTGAKEQNDESQKYLPSIIYRYSSKTESKICPLKIRLILIRIIFERGSNTVIKYITQINTNKKAYKTFCHYRNSNSIKF